MKVELFTPVNYYGKSSAITQWPVPARYFDSEAGVLSIQNGFDQFEAGYKAGFDWLNLAEHHYSPAQMTPAPQLFAAAVSQRLPGANISIIGTDLLLHNPINIAEQYAVLDNILGGRLRFGLLRGTPNEYLTYGTNPWESRERFEEAMNLVIHCLTEPEPFGWEGKYYRYRNISIFPSTVQKPHPPIILSGNSAASAAMAGRLHCDLGISFLPAGAAAANVAIYREAAAAAGWEPTPENILYRQFVYVAETDEQAAADVAEHGWPEGTGMINSNNFELLGAFGVAAAAAAGVPKGVVPDMSKAPVLFSPVWFGSPETVASQIREKSEAIGFGRIEIIVTGFVNAMSHEKVMRSIELMGETLVPALHADALTLV